MNKKPKICLILDNPLRDLEGLVLVAWHLTKLGAEVWLVPMYNQAFDVRALGADFVLMNYVRTNNLNHVLSYMRSGIKVGVLDTEGLGGKSPEEFAGLISKSGCAGLVDIYCVWGNEQYEAIKKHKVIPENKMRLTGCPRYDFCSFPWRNSLPQPNIAPDYILINTNFPAINPRFARSREDEIKSILSGGFSASLAEEYMRDASKTHKEIIELINHLIIRFPEQHFVLRPHPFESTESYKEAINAKNFEVRQEGTSIEWLNHAKVLIQLNCLTAIEATVFNIPSLTPSWLNKPALTVPLSNQLSINFDSEESFIEHLSKELEKPINNNISLTKKESIVDNFLLYDGKAAERVAQAIMDELTVPRKQKNLPKSPFRFHAISALRSILGYSLYKYFQNKLQDNALDTRKKSKLFSVEQVTSVINRIENSNNIFANVRVSDMSSNPLKCRYLASESSICLSSTEPTFT